MSAWLCGNKTLSLCVDIIKSEGFTDYDEDDYQSKSELELLNELSSLNTNSLNCRYGKRQSNILQDREYIPLDVEDGQRYKSVACYLYQTCECNKNYHHPLFRGLNRWRNDNEVRYEELWDKYHWDIDNPAPRRV